MRKLKFFQDKLQEQDKQKDSIGKLVKDLMMGNVKNLVKNLDTYNNKEILSKVEQEIMYINNLKQKQKYLEKLKNKLIKLEKKENSTSIFSKLFRR